MLRLKRAVLGSLFLFSYATYAVESVNEKNSSVLGNTRSKVIVCASVDKNLLRSLPKNVTFIFKIYRDTNNCMDQQGHDFNITPGEVLSDGPRVFCAESLGELNTSPGGGCGESTWNIGYSTFPASEYSASVNTHWSGNHIHADHHSPGVGLCTAEVACSDEDFYSKNQQTMYMIFNVKENLLGVNG